MIGKVLSCDMRSYNGNNYYVVCVIVDGVVGFLNSSDPLNVGEDVVLFLKTDKNHRFCLGF